eukprot:COSAG02_NODE_1023_length_15151_cov_745.123572_18_plen_71_part_00
MKFQVLITFNDNIVHEKIYNSLKEVASGLGLKYQQVADINCGRITPSFISPNFTFQPKININKIQPENIM